MWIKNAGARGGNVEPKPRRCVSHATSFMCPLRLSSASSESLTIAQGGPPLPVGRQRARSHLCADHCSQRASSAGLVPLSAEQPALYQPPRCARASARL